MPFDASDRAMNRLSADRAITIDAIDPVALERRARALQSEQLGVALALGTKAVGRGLAVLARRWRLYRERRQALARLSQLDDRLLADIGLSRGNLLGQMLRAEQVRSEPRRTVDAAARADAESRPAANANRLARAA